MLSICRASTTFLGAPRINLFGAPRNIVTIRLYVIMNFGTNQQSFTIYDDFHVWIFTRVRGPGSRGPTIVRNLRNGRAGPVHILV